MTDSMEGEQGRYLRCGREKKGNRGALWVLGVQPSTVVDRAKCLKCCSEFQDTNGKFLLLCGNIAFTLLMGDFSLINLTLQVVDLV